MSFNNRSIEERAADRQASRELVRQPIDLFPHELSARLHGRSLRRGGIYEVLGKYSFAALAEQYSINHQSSGHVYGGLRIGVWKMARWLAAAPEAYNDFSLERGDLAATEGLRQDLKSKPSQQNILSFMRLTLESELDTQRGLGLDTLEPATRLRDFRFVETDGEIGYVVDPMRLSKLTTPMKFGRATELPEQQQQCPGQGLALGRIWPAMVDLATDTPEVFPAHLSELQPGLAA
jgi:hypothetical protein